MMKKKYKVEGHYQINDGEVKDFDIEYENLEENEERKSKIRELLNHESIWPFLLNASKYGVRSIWKFFAVIFLFFYLNAGSFLYGLYAVFNSGQYGLKAPFMLLLFFIGIGFTGYVAYKAYHVMMFDVVRVMYENSRSFFHKVCSIIIDKVSGVFKGNVKVTDKELAKALNYASIVNDNFNHIPWFVRKGAIFILKRVPVIGMLIRLKEDLVAGDNDLASNKLLGLLDDGVAVLFEQINYKWIWPLLFGNWLIIFLILKSKVL